MKLPLSREEIDKQMSILEFYEAFNMDEFGAYLYDNLKYKGLAGGRIKTLSNSRDYEMTLVYEDENGNTTKDVVLLNVFDVFGQTKLKKDIIKLLNNYYIKKFGSEYTKILSCYRNYKDRKSIREYVKGEELLLQPWNEKLG